MKGTLFNTKMVMAIKDDLKTATRRIIKPQPKSKLAYVSAGHGHGKWHYPSEDAWKYWDDESFKHSDNLTEEDLKQFWTPPAQPGDILYVRETWSRLPLSCDKYIHVYRADYAPSFKSSMFKWHPSIHMPKETARLFLRVTSVRAERLQDMTLDDFCSEGVGIRPEAFNDPENAYWQGREAYIDTWNSIYASPQPVKENGKIVRYESYPWEDIRETRTYRGLPWLVIGNPWIWVVEFERISKEEALKNE